MSNLVRFADGVVVEVSANQAPAEPIASKSAERLTQGFQSAADVLGTALRSVIGTIQQAARETNTTSVEVEFGVSISVEGSIYITKVTGEGNITVKATVYGAKA